MGKPSKIAQIGVLNILNQMKNPLTNIRLSVDILENNPKDEDILQCKEIIKKSAIKIEDSIRDLCNSFTELGISLHIEEDNTII